MSIKPKSNGTSNGGAIESDGVDRIVFNADGSITIKGGSVNGIEISNTGVVTFPATPNTQLGVGQTWQNFLGGSRVFGTTYTNSTGKPIYVTVVGYASSASQGLVATVAGVSFTLAYSQANGTGGVFRGASGSFIVPAGATYSVSLSGGTLDNWSELR